METKILIPKELKIILNKNYDILHHHHNYRSRSPSIERYINLSKRNKRISSSSSNHYNLLNPNNPSTINEQVEKPSSSSSHDLLQLNNETENGQSKKLKRQTSDIDEFNSDNDDVLVGTTKSVSELKCKNPKLKTVMFTSSSDSDSSLGLQSEKFETKEKNTKRSLRNHKSIIISDDEGSETNESSDDNNDDKHVSSGISNKSRKIKKRFKNKICHHNSIKICTKQKIEKGTRLSPNDGQAKVLIVEGLVTIPKDDIRLVFGCFDRLMDDPLKSGEQIRLCNWLRFIPRRYNKYDSQINLIAKFIDRSPVVEFTQNLSIGEELVIYFDLDSIITTRSEFQNEFQRLDSHSMFLIKSEHQQNHLLEASEAPLDLSKSPNSIKSSPSSSSKRSFTSTDNYLPEPKTPLSPSSSSSSSPPPSSPCSNNEDDPEEPDSNVYNSNNKNSASLNSNLFSIRNVLQSRRLFQPQLCTSSSVNSNTTLSNSHNEPLMLTPPLSSSTVTTSANLSSPTDSTNSMSLYSPNSQIIHNHQQQHNKIPSFSNNNANSKANGSSNYDLYASNNKRKRFTHHHNSLHNILNHYSLNSSIVAAAVAANNNNNNTSNNTSIIMPIIPSINNNTSTSLLNVRPILRTRGRERSLLPCEICSKAFDRPSLLKRHMRTHTGEKPHVCDTCGKGFSTSSSLNTHRRIHSGEKPHQCPICGKRFTASSNLYYHRMTHNKEKPHKCLLCGKSFPTPGDLKSHQYVHSGSWPFSCRICNRGFSKQTNLRNHLLLHSGDKPHTCRICHKKFALACNLRAHLRTHEEDPASTCILCKRTYLNSMNMIINGQCRPCSLKLHQHSSSSPVQMITTTTAAQSSNNPDTTVLSTSATKFHSGTLTSDITIPQPNTLINTKVLENKDSITSKLSSHALLNDFNSLPSLHAHLHPHLQHQQYLQSFPNTSASSPTSPQPPAPLRPFLPTTVSLEPHQLNHFGRPNPFLEQLLEWNWRFAKETVGNLGLMQQKLFESQMLAAQLMTNPGSISDILRYHSVTNANSIGINHNNSNNGGNIIPAILGSKDFISNSKLSSLDEKK